MLIGREITVLGGGIAGLAAATALAQRGAQVRVLEQSPQIAELGAGLQISPNGATVLHALGLGAGLSEAASLAQAVSLRDFRRGAEVFRLPLTRPDRPYHFIHRADLIGMLHQGALSAGVTIKLDHAVEKVTEGAGAMTLHFADGGAETTPCLIAADGLHSPTRAALNPRSQPFFTGQVAWRCILPLTGATPPPAEAQVFMGPGRHLVRYPLRKGTVLNVVAVEERDAWATEGWHHRDDPTYLRRAFRDFAPEIRQMLDRATEVYLWGLFRHPLARHWHSDHAALIGDAAHPTLPFLAQGANMALEDAWVLADSLAQEADLPTGFARYEARRRRRCARIVDAASKNAENYHLRPGPYRFAAHTALRMASRFAPHLASNRFEWLYGHDVTRP
ncbi:FAD-binding protein [Rhodophyticola sp. CCM32]|uniref:FAD-dependent oxidoreductase n=1 Tax=Rhodophyticola sp. CCM32 TaxID=2916397 RepID=UPI00107F7474|nr:FAD-dependent oxidoreductase [Rhodophyticola sp. CCM32]QBX99725.1 FAD-binding protein [Rhodophyticola sp. CCM32]